MAQEEAADCTDPWPYDTNYFEWTTDEICDWLIMLHSEFENYSGRVETRQLDGNDFERMVDEKYLREELGITNRSHSLGLSRTIRNRIDKYKEFIRTGVPPINYNRQNNNNKQSSEPSVGDDDFTLDQITQEINQNQKNNNNNNNIENNNNNENNINNNNNNNGNSNNLMDSALFVDNPNNNNININNNIMPKISPIAKPADSPIIAPGIPAIPGMNNNINNNINNNMQHNVGIIPPINDITDNKEASPNIINPVNNNNNINNIMNGINRHNSNESPYHGPIVPSGPGSDEYEIVDEPIDQPGMVIQTPGESKHLSNGNNNNNNNYNNNIMHQINPGMNNNNNNLNDNFRSSQDDAAPIAFDNPFQFPNILQPEPEPEPDDDPAYLFFGEDRNEKKIADKINSNSIPPIKPPIKPAINDDGYKPNGFDKESDSDETIWRDKIVESKSIDYENEYFTAQLSEETELELNNEFKATPDMPYKEHINPNLKPMSNRFRTNGPNKYIYPPKNGPFATCRQLDISPYKYPLYDIEDELFNNHILGTEFVRSNNFNVKYAIEQLTNRYAQDLAQLMSMGYNDRYRNLRALLRYDNEDDRITKVTNEFADFDASSVQYDGLYVGDTVIRGPDWKWGGQDGGISYNNNNNNDEKEMGRNNNNNNKGLKGTVRGVRRWHPDDKENKMTSCVVVWEHGLYGNYRFDYRGAFDVKVVDRLYFSNPDIDRKMRLQGGRKLLGGAGGMSISIGDQVIRGQRNWRWGDQDGGCKGVGTIIEIYASPSPFEAGAVIGVMWDKDKNKWRQKAVNFMNKKEKWDRDYQQYIQHIENNNNNGNDADDEYEISDEPSPELEVYNEAGDVIGNSNNQNNLNNNNNNNNINKHELSLFNKHLSNPHNIKFFKKRRKYRKYKHGINWNLKSLQLNYLQLNKDNLNILLNINHDEISTSESDDWSEPDFDEMLSKPIPKYLWGINESYELEINQIKRIDKDKFVSIDDRCERGPNFIPPKKGDYKSQQGIVLRVEQWDPRRIESNEIIGDKVWLTWDALRGFKFGYNNEYEIKKVKSGEVFKYEHAKIRVGDRVQRGIFWHYDEEDGGMLNNGEWSKGTVSCIQHKLRVTGLIVRVKWHRNNHVNQYSWGFRNIFDLKKIKNQNYIAPAADQQPGM